MQEVRRRFLHRGDDLRMTVAGTRDRDPTHEVEKAVSVDILDHYALAARNDQRIILQVRVRRMSAVAIDDRLRPSTVEGGFVCWVTACSSGGRWAARQVGMLLTM